MLAGLSIKEWVIVVTKRQARRKSKRVLMRQRRGTYIIEDPSHSSVVVIGKLWKSVVARAMKIFNINLPKGPPPGACA